MLSRTGRTDAAEVDASTPGSGIVEIREGKHASKVTPPRGEHVATPNQGRGRDALRGALGFVGSKSSEKGTPMLKGCRRGCCAHA